MNSRMLKNRARSRSTGWRINRAKIDQSPSELKNETFPRDPTYWPVAVTANFQQRFSPRYDIFQLFPSLSCPVPFAFHRSTDQGQDNILPPPCLLLKRLLKSVLFFLFAVYVVARLSTSFEVRVS